MGDDTALCTDAAHDSDVAYGSIAVTCERAVYVDEDTEFVFPDGTAVNGQKLSFLLKALENIINKDYPEELL